MTSDDTFGLPPDTQRDAQLTSASIHMDFVDWRKGRRRYAVWAIDVDSASLRAATARLRHALDDCLLSGYDRQAHITLRVCGFPATERGLDDDYTPTDFARHVDALTRTVKGVRDISDFATRNPRLERRLSGAYANDWNLP